MYIFVFVSSYISLACFIVYFTFTSLLVRRCFYYYCYYVCYVLFNKYSILNISILLRWARVCTGVWAASNADTQVGCFTSDAVRLPRADLCAPFITGQQCSQQAEAPLSDIHCPLCYRFILDSLYTTAALTTSQMTF